MSWIIYGRVLAIINTLTTIFVLAAVFTQGGTLQPRAEPADATGVIVFIVLFCIGNLVAVYRVNTIER